VESAELAVHHAEIKVNQTISVMITTTCCAVIQEEDDVKQKLGIRHATQ
jgi:hypothetical protein